MELIDKAAVVAEIERLKECNRKICAGNFDFLKKTYPERYYSTEIYNKILSFINTLEVKEVDFEKIWEEYFKYRGDVATVNVKHLAHHFFELGMAVSSNNRAKKI